MFCLKTILLCQKPQDFVLGAWSGLAKRYLTLKAIVGSLSYLSGLFWLIAPKFWAFGGDLQMTCHYVNKDGVVNLLRGGGDTLTLHFVIKLV